MQYRIAAPGDEPAFLSLWQRVFGDGEAFARFAFERYAGPGNVYVADTGGGCGAILCAVPSTFSGQACAYFYGLATEPALRGRGVMSGLMEWVCQLLVRQGVKFVLLVPAGDSLYRYYASRGFSTAFYRACGQIYLTNTISVQAVLRPLEAETMAALRDRWLPEGAFRLSPDHENANFRQLQAEGWLQAECGSGYGVFTVQEEVVCHELFASTGAEALAILSSAASANGTAQIRLRLPPSPLLPGGDPPRPLAMLRRLCESPATGAPYLALDCCDF